jgi:DNA polymerase III gamma/tau subunit
LKEEKGRTEGLKPEAGEKGLSHPVSEPEAAQKAKKEETASIEKLLQVPSPALKSSPKEISQIHKSDPAPKNEEMAVSNQIFKEVLPRVREGEERFTMKLFPRASGKFRFPFPAGKESFPWTSPPKVP